MMPTILCKCIKNLNMKTLKLSVLAFVLMFIQTNAAFPQAHIDSLRIIPSTPLNTDTVKIVAYTYQPSAPCRLEKHFITINPPQIYVQTHYPPGMLTVTCSSVDTIIAGVLTEGCYQLLFYMSDTALPITYDMDSLSFCVGTTSAIKSNTREETKISIFPNPCSGIAFITIDDAEFSALYDISICDLFGREIKKISQHDLKQLKISFENISPGIYFLKLIRNGSFIGCEKMILE